MREPPTRKVTGRLAAAAAALVSSAPVLAQPVPTSYHPPISGPTSIIVGRTADYLKCWRGAEGVPYIWNWTISSGGIRVHEDPVQDKRCMRVRVRFPQTGSVRIGYSATSNGHGWPSPPALSVTVRWPTLKDTSGKYRIRSAITRNGKPAGPATSRDVSETDVVRLRNGVSAKAPKNRNVICSNILDVPSGWYPRENGRRIYRCKVI